MSFRNYVLLGGAFLSLGACTKVDFGGAHYWEKTDINEKLYTQGPKSQKLLDRDLARCTAKIREVSKFEPVNKAIPADNDGRVLDADEKSLADWDAPKHDGALLAEHSTSHDFEGCMRENGWERTQFIPYDVADEAKANWHIANVNYGYDPRIPKAEPEPGDKGNFSKLND